MEFYKLIYKSLTYLLGCNLAIYILKCIVLVHIDFVQFIVEQNIQELSSYALTLF